MRTSKELSTLYRSIDQKNISDSAKETLKKIRLANKNFKGKDEDAQELFIDFYNKLKSSKPVAVKTTKEYKDAVKKAQIERGRKMREAKGNPKAPKGVGTEEDANRPAKPFGWRMRGKHNYRRPTRDDISKGRAYYEGRVNRADVKRKKYPMLAKGGMAEGGEVYYVNDFYPNYDEDKIAQVLKDNGFKKVRKGKKYGWSNQPDVVIFQGDKNKAKEILEKEFDNYISIWEKDWGRKYEYGGYMAEGGEFPNAYLEKEELDHKINWLKQQIESDYNNGEVDESTERYEEELESLQKRKEIIMSYSNEYAKGGILYSYNVKDGVIEIYMTDEDDENAFNSIDEIVEQVQDEYPNYKIILKQTEFKRYAKGGKLGLNTYKLRAEGLNDFLSFLQTGMYMRMKSFTIKPIGVPEVVVTFVTDASLSEIKSKLKEVQDSHVMLETLKPIDEYTGERDEMMAKGGTIKVGDKVRSTTFKGVEGKVISKKGDMLFIEKYNALPNGDTQRDVLRISEVEKMAEGGEVFYTEKHKND